MASGQEVDGDDLRISRFSLNNCMLSVLIWFALMRRF